MKYQFVNAEHTIVRADDGSTFELPRDVHPSNIAGHAVEQWRREGCPAPMPYSVPAVTPDDHARAQRRATDERRRVR